MAGVEARLGLALICASAPRLSAMKLRSGSASYAASAMTWPRPSRPDSRASACGQSPDWPGVGRIRNGRPIASTAACSLVLGPPRERPMAAASAPLLRLPHRHGPSLSCCRSAHIQSPACQPNDGKDSRKSPRATRGENARGQPSTCRKPPANRASGQRFPPSTGSHRQRAGYRSRSVPACQRGQEGGLQSGPIVCRSMFVCSRSPPFSILNQKHSDLGIPRMQTEPSGG